MTTCRGDVRNSSVPAQAIDVTYRVLLPDQVCIATNATADCQKVRYGPSYASSDYD